MKKAILLTLSILALVTGQAFAQVRSNVAVGQQVACQTSGGFSFAPQNITDGQRQTAWEGTRFPDSCTITLSSPKLVDQFIVRMPFNPSYSTVDQRFSMEYSLDGNNWTELRNSNGWVGFYYCDGSQSFPGACSLAVSFGVNVSYQMKYFRMKFVDRQVNGVHQNGGTIGDLELYGH